jgi:hypothetical protein
MNLGLVERALMRVQSHLLASDSPEACVLASELRGEHRRVGSVVAGILAGRAPDGSWAGELDSTAAALLLLADVDPAAQRRGVARAVQEGVAWVQSKRGTEGRYGEGCDAARHAEGLCHHFLGGFFGFGHGVPSSPLAESRLIASCEALRALLRWRPPAGDDALHLDGARMLLERWTRWDERPPRPAGYLAALGLIVSAPRDPARDAAAEHALGIVSRAQRGDGSWPDADPFAVLEVVDLAFRGERRGAPLSSMLERGAGLLAATQNEQGGWGRGAPHADLLTAWRTLRRAAGAGSAEEQDLFATS